MSLEIVGFPRSNFVRSVRMVAEEKGVPYVLVPETPHSETVKGINPTGKIPAMRHDGLELCESMAIARYIEDAFTGPKTIPTDLREAAQVNRWTAFAATEVDQLLMRNYVVEYAFHKDEDGNTVRTKIDKALKRFPRMFRTLETAVETGFFGTASFSMADCFILPILNATNLWEEGQEAIASSPKLAEYFRLMQKRPSFEATAP
ncbi:MAG: glutathione S-transferase family protein [Pseudomonadota bacterium]|nr:glutathione S-transferase family protein [Pseudomonadota bacterium]